MSNPEPRHCLNCEAELLGFFCSQCGQKDIELNMTLRTMVGEFAGGIVSFDSRIYRTFKLLILKPGQLTKDYIEGKRESQVPPLKLYLFATILAVFLLTIVDSGIFKVTTSSGQPANQQSTTAPATDLADQDSDPTQSQSEDDSTANQDEGAQPSETPSATESAPSESLTFNQRLQKNARKAQADPQRMSRLIVQSIPKAMFMLLPLFALLLRLFYWKSEFRYPQWFIFSLHYHAFGFFLFALGAIFIGLDIKMIFRVIAIIVPNIYLYISLRRLTGQSRLVTLLKIILFSLAYSIAMAAAMLLITGWALYHY